MTAPNHQDPFLLVLPEGANPGAEIVALIGHPAVRHFALPPVWALDAAGVDLPRARPDLATVTMDNLPDVVEALRRLCDAKALDELVGRTWAQVDEMVRDFYLQRSTLQTFASIFRMGPKSLEVEPPPQFRADRIQDNGFEVQYRLAQPSDSDPSRRAPSEEGSVVLYPFDPRNSAGRAEAGIEAGDGVVLEVFAYAQGRSLHRDVMQQVANERGWTLVDPHEPQF